MYKILHFGTAKNLFYIPEIELNYISLIHFKVEEKIVNFTLYRR